MQQNYDNLNKEENIDKVSFKSHGKGILDLIREDEGLSKKVTYEEFYGKENDDASTYEEENLEEAFKIYEETVKECGEKSPRKSIMDLIKEDAGLSKKVTYEEFKKESHGVDDSSLEEAYKEYEAFVDTHDIKPKGLEDYLRDDSSLLEKVSIDKIRGKK